MNIKKRYIHAERNESDTYDEYEIADSINALTANYEYGDVKESKYQIWEYPSGKLFKLVPDRQMDTRDYYASPSKNLWQPKLVEIGVDKEKVRQAYERLISGEANKNELSLFSILKRLFKKRRPDK